MHIAIDLDDVVLQFVNNLCNVLNVEYDVQLSPEEHIDEWDLAPVLDPIVGENWWNWWQERDWLWALAPAVPGAIGGIRNLRKQGHYLEIVTSKPEWAEAQTWRWLGKWRPPVHRVTIVPFSGVGSAKKHEVTEASLLIDDKPDTCEDWVASREDRRAILFDRPHNRNHTIKAERIVRLARWPEIVKEVSLINV